MKVYAAWVNEKDRFLIPAKSMELAKLEAVNVTVALYLEHGIILKVVKVEEYQP